MADIVKTLKISSKGQITLPKEIRERLGGDVIRVVADDRGIRLEPTASLAGSLRRYAKPYKSWEEVRDQAGRQATKRLVKNARRRP